MLTSCASTPSAGTPSRPRRQRCRRSHPERPRPVLTEEVIGYGGDEEVCFGELRPRRQHRPTGCFSPPRPVLPLSLGLAAGQPATTTIQPPPQVLPLSSVITKEPQQPQPQNL
jgi:hypothetical protein